MKYTHYDLGYLEKGRTIVISLQGNQANVQLMDSSNYQNYKNRRRYHYIGGLARRSQVQLTTNKSAHWHLTVDLGGYGGNVKSSIEILPAPLPEIPQIANEFDHPSILAKLLQPAQDNSKSNEQSIEQFDVFISHASEDKESVARPLAFELEKLGLRVWYDESKLNIGDSIRTEIDKGLTSSRFGIIVISKFFMQKKWTQYELNGIIAKHMEGQQKILPIWHNITKQELINFSPTLCDLLACNTATHTLNEIAMDIASAIKKTV